MPRPPTKSKTASTLSTGNDEIDQFLDAVKSTPVATATEQGQAGQLIFALDATASRQATWDQASALQADMFTKTQGLSALNLQLVYFRGYNECRASPWLDNSQSLLRMMNKIKAMVFVGDAMEEDVDALGELAGQLKLLGLPVFVFQEGYDMVASMAFKQIAQLSGGAHCRFDANSAQQLGQLLNAVAAYAAGGREALLRLSGNGSKQAALLLEQLR